MSSVGAHIAAAQLQIAVNDFGFSPNIIFKRTARFGGKESVTFFVCYIETNAVIFVECCGKTITERTGFPGIQIIPAVICNTFPRSMKFS